jgi:hypothetical protein
MDSIKHSTPKIKYNPTIPFYEGNIMSWYPGKIIREVRGSLKLSSQLRRLEDVCNEFRESIRKAMDKLDEIKETEEWIYATPVESKTLEEMHRTLNEIYGRIYSEVEHPIMRRAVVEKVYKV